MRIITKTKQNARKNKWLYIPTPKMKPMLKLLFFHFAGVGAEVYHMWRDRFPEDVEFCAVQLPGRSNRADEPCIVDFGDLIDELYCSIKGYITTPFAVFGHCMGGLVIFELVQHLRRNGHDLPKAIFVSGSMPPDVLVMHPDMHSLTDDELMSVLATLDMRPDEFFQKEDVLKRQLPILKSDFNLVEKWRYNPDNTRPVAVPIISFGGDADNFVLEKHVRHWEKFTTSHFDSHILSGGHFFLNDEAERDKMVSIMNDTIWCHL